MREWAVGDTIPALELTVDGPSMKLLAAIMHDPNPLHYDPEAVRAAGLGDKPINQGTINMAYPINALLRVLDTPGQLKRLKCRFQGSLVAGDRVIASGMVTAITDETIAVDIWLDHVGGARVLNGSALIARS